uniref:Uncharacterized protein n=1 Tax=Panagrolaimus sp. ES5 TaxID=591445 RepID=A0AC34FYW4_9BILA
MLYLELSLGQFSQSGPATVHGKIRPYAQGVGWGMAVLSLLVSVYYNVIVAWTLVFIVSIFMGQSKNWALCGNDWNDQTLALSKGVKLIGKLSYITATVPYLIITILFVRSVTLPASYNPRSHNCFRDALIITAADGFMSIFGGTAVFSILGFMAEQQKKDITQVVSSGVGLAFIAYPEAMNQITIVPWLWAFLFFVMLFLLGISSQFGLAEVMCTAIYDQFPSTQNRHFTVASCVCFVLFLLGIIMTTKAGIFYFMIFNDFSASLALCVLILLELILVCYVYGIRNYIKDLRSMFGYPTSFFGKIFVCYVYGIRNYIKDLRSMFGYPTSFFGKIFGKSGWYFIIVWSIVAPVCISLQVL